MNILKFISEERHFTLINYGPNDLSTGYNIHKLMDNSTEIISYYTAKEKTVINNIDDYIDLLFLDFVKSFDEFVDIIKPPHNATIKNIINYASAFRLDYKNKQIITFINERYDEILSYKDKYIRKGLKERTLDYILKFNKGLDFEKITNYLLQQHIIFFIDNIESLYPIIKNHNKGLMENLFDENVPFNKLVNYRFEDVCKLCINFHRLNESRLSQRLANKLFSFIKNEYDSFVEGEPPYGLVNNFKVMTRTLKIIKNKNYYESKEIYSRLEQLSNDYLENHGQVHEYEISNKEYMNLIEKTEEARLHDMDKVFLLSHRFDSNRLWASVLEEFNNQIEPSIIDMASSPTDTNDYFTLSRQQMNHEFIDKQSVNVAYWLAEDKIDGFFSVLIFNVQVLSSELQLTLELGEEMNYLQSAIATIYESDNTRQDILIYNTTFYVITLIERILRELFVYYEEDAIFNIEQHTMSKLLDEKSPIESLVGQHQVNWLRFFLLKRDNIGFDLRNRIAHMRDISISNFNIFDLYRMLWFLTSTINSILINSINKELNK
ncbi:hypothetical protein SAMN05421676_103110 [Salinibacillus kushneri]|uniref:DUF4209 domain-containing protein n=1 Tax=Salinibacillus kushneri TaxID=237682 RepID=A0A1I0CCW9_9BACI|nr:hypothetical protein [Salinibacillus kushneri]SET16955.1 hypothetical protein SAMN05421676_103110 [Salinibacillus kushneri]